MDMNKELMKENLGQAVACILKVGDMIKEAEEWDKVSNDILYVERSFGRSLTLEEKQLLRENGKSALFDKLGLNEDDFNTMLRAFALISAGFTESSDRYDYELEQNNYKALDLFKSLVNDLECVEAERHKVKIGKRENLGTKINVKGENAGYKEENDPELNDIFKNSEKSACLDNYVRDNTYEDPDLNKVFASETKCEAMGGITGDTYDETKDPDVFEKDINKESFEDKIKQAIDRLDKGCELELDDETIDAIVERLWKERDNVSIKIHNNKISLR